MKVFQKESPFYKLLEKALEGDKLHTKKYEGA